MHNFREKCVNIVHIPNNSIYGENYTLVNILLLSRVIQCSSQNYMMQSTGVNLSHLASTGHSQHLVTVSIIAVSLLCTQSSK
jgi:hypothetical protein